MAGTRSPTAAVTAGSANGQGEAGAKGQVGPMDAPEPRSVETLRAALLDPKGKPEATLQAIGRLSRFALPELPELVAQALAVQTDEAVLVSLLDLLAAAGERSILERIAPLLESPSPDIAARALRTMMALDQARALACAAPLLAGAQAPAARTLARCLGECHPEASFALTRTLAGSKDRQERIAAHLLWRYIAQDGARTQARRALRLESDLEVFDKGLALLLRASGEQAGDVLARLRGEFSSKLDTIARIERELARAPVGEMAEAGAGAVAGRATATPEGEPAAAGHSSERATPGSFPGGRTAPPPSHTTQAAPPAQPSLALSDGPLGATASLSASRPWQSLARTMDRKTLATFAIVLVLAYALYLFQSPAGRAAGDLTDSPLGRVGAAITVKGQLVDIHKNRRILLVSVKDRECLVSAFFATRYVDRFEIGRPITVTGTIARITAEKIVVVDGTDVTQ